jgi:hypothetical protein
MTREGLHVQRPEASLINCANNALKEWSKDVCYTGSEAVKIPLIVVHDTAERFLLVESALVDVTI